MEEAEALLQEVTSASDDDFGPVMTYDRLLCADNDLIATHARRAGLRSDNSAIRAEALKHLLFEREAVVLTFVDDGLSEEQSAYVAGTPTHAYPIIYWDYEAGCLSLRLKDECEPRNMVTVAGSEVSILGNKTAAKLRLEEDGVLRGTWTLDSGREPMSLPVELRLD